MARQRQVRGHRHAPGAIGSHAQLLAQRRRRDARRPQHRAAVDAHAAQGHAVGVDRRHGLPGVHLHAELLQLLAGLFRQLRRHGRQHAGPRFDQVHAGAAHVGAAEFARQRVPCYLGQGAGQLHAGGATADHHELQPALPRLRIRFALGGFEGRQHAAADRQRVLERLQPGGVPGPVVVAEVGVGGAGGDQQVVVVQRAAGQRHPPRGQVDRQRLVQPHRDVFLLAQDVPQRRRDVGRRQARGGHLVQQRLEQVVVGAVHQGDAHRRGRERARGPQPSEAATQHQNMRFTGVFHALSFSRGRWDPRPATSAPCAPISAPAGAAATRAAPRAAGRAGRHRAGSARAPCRRGAPSGRASGR